MWIFLKDPIDSALYSRTYYEPTSDWWPRPNSCQFATYLSVAPDWVTCNGLHLQWDYLMEPATRAARIGPFRSCPWYGGECSGRGPIFGRRWQLAPGARAAVGALSGAAGYSLSRRYLHSTLNQLTGTSPPLYNPG